MTTPYIKETRKGKYWIFYLTNGPIKVSWFKISNRLRIEFTRQVNNDLFNIFLLKHEKGEVYRYGESGFITKGPRTPSEVLTTITALTSGRMMRDQILKKIVPPMKYRV